MRSSLTLVACVVLAACSGPNLFGQAGSDGARSSKFVDAALTGGLPEAALTATRTTLERDPTNVQALIQQGDALSALNRFDVAAEAYQRALSVDASSTTQQTRRARLGLGRAKLEMGAGLEAEAVFLAFITNFPDDSKGYDGLGIALDLQGKHGKAQQEYRLALARGATDGTRVNLGLSLAIAGDTGQALAILRPIAAAQDATPRTRHDLAVALTLAGDGAAASRILSQDLPHDQVTAAISGYNALRVAER